MRSIDDVLEGLTKCKMHPPKCDSHCPYASRRCTSELLDDARVWLQQLLWEKRQADKMRKIIRRIIGVLCEKDQDSTYYASDVKLMLEDILKEMRTYDDIDQI